jgi:peptide/nickel transport system permease protein
MRSQTHESGWDDTMSTRSRWHEFKNRMKPTLRELKFTTKRIKRSPLSIVGIAIVTFYAVLALLAPVIAPPYGRALRDAYQVPNDGWGDEPKPPGQWGSQEHWHIFGTAQGQFDIFYGCVWGTRTAFRIGFVVVAAALVIGLVIGSISGYYGGIIDEIMMRFTDIIFAFPGLILCMALVVAFGPTLDSVVLALCLVGWPSYTRVIRGEVLRVRSEDYVEAAKAAGCSDFRVVTKHILPNAIYPVLIMASLDIGAIVLTAAALSFLGLYGTSGYADWGQMISYSRNWIVGPPTDPYKYWFTFLIPGIFIFIFVLGWNLLGDAFRDILDPTLRRR